MTSSINQKYITYHYAERGGPSHVTGNMHKIFGADRSCSSRDMITDGQTNRQTDIHGQYNILLPIGGGVISYRHWIL